VIYPTCASTTAAIGATEIKSRNSLSTARYSRVLGPAKEGNEMARGILKALMVK
jgi:hypothetical protein